MEKLIKVLQFFRLVDENKVMSITNITVMIAAYKVSKAPATSFEDIGLLLIPLLGYVHKRHINK